MVQWLRLHTPNAGGTGLIPGQGTRSHMLQLRVHMPQLLCVKLCVPQLKPSTAKYIYIFKKIIASSLCFPHQKIQNSFWVKYCFFVIQSKKECFAFLVFPRPQNHLLSYFSRREGESQWGHWLDHLTELVSAEVETWTRLLPALVLFPSATFPPSPLE